MVTPQLISPGFINPGLTLQWFIMENPHLKWMTTRGTRMTMETPDMFQALELAAEGPYWQAIKIPSGCVNLFRCSSPKSLAQRSKLWISAGSTSVGDRFHPTGTEMNRNHRSNWIIHILDGIEIGKLLNGTCNHISSSWQFVPVLNFFPPSLICQLWSHHAPIKMPCIPHHSGKQKSCLPVLDPKAVGEIFTTIAFFWTGGGI